MEGLRAAQWQSPRFGRLILQWCGGRTCQKMPASGLGSWRGEARGRHLAPYRFSWERGGGGGPPAWAQGPSLPCFPAGRPVSVLSSSSLRLLPCWHRRLPLSRKSLYKTSLPPDAGFLGPCLGKP